jgi:multidrug efflux pump subunit AcrA (membrane-fusion protein)
MLTQLDSDIRAAEVKWRNEKDSYEEEQTKLKEIEAQIACCKIHAPSAGQVVYANVQSSRSGSEFVVEPGAMVRERQVLLRLPDPTNMQIRATISESRINLVHEGMAVDIRIDAFGDRSLRGEVTKVNKYAEPGNWWSSTAKQYATFIKVFEPPPELRVGLTAEVQIQVERRDQAIQIPVQAVYEKEGRTFCLVQKEAAWETREVVISSTNDKMVALDEERSEQMHAGELVVINPRRHLDKFDSKRLKAADLNGNRSLDITELDAAASRMGAARAPAKTTTPGGGA